MMKIHSELDARQAGILLLGISLVAYGVVGLNYGYHSRLPVLVFLITFVALSGTLFGGFLKQRR